MYHMICEPKNNFERRYACPPKRFEKHMHFLSRGSYNVVSFSEICRYMRGQQELLERSIAVTLDDGFGDNYESAWPILKTYGIPATIFLTAGMIGKTNEWMAKDQETQKQMLRWDQVRAMAETGISFGAHTVTHPVIPELPAQEAAFEIEQSKRIIEEKLGVSSPYFAYPYGLFEQQTCDLVKNAGYSLACSTRSGFNHRRTDTFALRRIEVYGTDSVWQLRNKLVFGTNDGSLRHLLCYYHQRIKDRLWEKYTDQ